jgi:DNA-binding NarL/FixJ family response regulator
MIRIAIVDDQDIVRESLKILLSTQADFDVVGTGKDGYDALKLVDTFHPDILLLDIRMPIMNGVETTGVIKLRSPNTSIIILTTFDDDEYLLKAIKNGASGYLLKNSAMDELIKAIRTVYAGGSLMTPEVTSKVFRLFSELIKNKEDEGKNNNVVYDIGNIPSTLSRTEIDIICHIAKGMANKEIASEMSLSEGTIRNYISSILQKIGLRDRTQIALWAIHHNINKNI